MTSQCVFPDSIENRVHGVRRQAFGADASVAGVCSDRDHVRHRLLRLGSVAGVTATVVAAASVFTASVAVTLAAVAVIGLAGQTGEDGPVPLMEVTPSPEALFEYDFASDDMRIPEGAVAEIRDIRLGDDADPEQRGLIATVSGYVLPSGAFKQHGGWTVWWDDDKTVEAEVGGARHGRKHGPALAFFPTGQRARQEAWVHGVRHGVSRTWDEASVCRRVERHFDGQLEGRAESWYASGQKQAESHWREGREHGSVRTWREDGRLESEAEFADGVRQERFAFASERR
jgi:antitoxin component YwqK of YwqJK toxin-antitoxin module